jgi:hypothetical protein
MNDDALSREAVSTSVFLGGDSMSDDALCFAEETA